MPSYEKTIERWLAIERGERPGRGGYLSHWRMPCRPGAIASYGWHFVLAETVRDSKGKIRCFLLNGDRSTVTTMGKHQPAIRSVLQASGTPCIIIPFSALAAARIDRQSIRPVDIRSDRVDRWREAVPGDYANVRWSGVLDKRNGYPAGEGDVGAIFEGGRIPGNPDGSANRTHRRWDFGSSTFVDCDPPLVRIYHNGDTVEWDHDLGWTIERTKHWLGDSLFRGRVAPPGVIGGGGWHTFLSSFDYQERPALYFLAEVPRKAKARTVEDAILALSPPIVHAAVAQGREVKRQGDMFAIPTALTTRQVRERSRSIQRMQGVFGTDHVCTEVAVGKRGVTYVRGNIHHRPGGVSDHRRVPLGTEWHLIVPNTVPRRRVGAMVRV